MASLINWITDNRLTAVMIIIIIAVFLYFWLVYERKLCKLYHALDKAGRSNAPCDELSKTKLSHLARDYQRLINIRTDAGDRSNTPASEIFTVSNTVKAWGINLRLLDTASATLVGLGLFGTFLGLMLGVYGFDSANSEKIQESINTLLNGMSTAFLTSLVGMAASIIFTSFFDKPRRNKFLASLSDFNAKLDALYYIDDVALDHIHQQNAFNNLFANLKVLFEGLSTNVLNEINRRLTYMTSDGQKVNVSYAIRDMSYTVRDILEENKEQTKALKSFSTDLALELNNGFDEVLSRQMQQKIIPLMNNIDATTKAVVAHIDQMAQTMSAPATDMIQTVTTDLKSCMESIVDEFKQSVSDRTSKELEGLATHLGTVAQSMANFPQTMEEMTATLHATIAEVKRTVTEASSSSVQASSTIMQQIQEQMAHSIEAISTAIDNVKEVMNGITQASQTQSNQMVSQLSEAAEKMVLFLNSTATRISSTMQSSFQEMANDMAQKQAETMALQEGAMGRTMDDVRTVMNGMTQSAQQQSEQMLAQMTETAEKMKLFLGGVVTDLSRTVESSIKGIADDVTNKQADLLVLQEDTIADIRKMLTDFNESLEQLDKVNSDTMGNMLELQKAHGYIADSTSNLRTLSDDLLQAADRFQQAQRENNDNLAELQTQSQEGIDDLTNLLIQSGQLSADYAEKFETIRQGLSSIFSQMQTGLNQYSETVKSSTQEYLKQYSTSLTQTTDALRGTIQQQTDVVDMLVEALDKKKEK